MQYAAVIERSISGYGAYLPDLPGCVAVGKTREEVVSLIREAVDLHLQLMREQGDEIPEATSTVELVEVAA
jgi:predicted RNase H-like HicB family nuclease